jgi:hypothetical protein
MLAGAAVLFVLASAIVAFQGWPRIASQGAPASVQINAAPATGSRVSRRLRAVSVGGPAVAAHPAVSRGAAVVAPRTAHPVGFRIRNTASAPAGLAPGGTTRSAGGSRNSGLTARVGSRGGGNVSITTSTNPPVSVTVPVGKVVNTFGSVIKKVTGNSGSRVVRSTFATSKPASVLGH